MSTAQRKFKLIVVKTFIGLGSIVFMMSNTNCQQQADFNSPLKKNVRVIGVGATSMLDASNFNFSEVATNQFSGVLFDTNHFFARTEYPQIVEVEEKIAVVQNGIKKMSIVQKPKLRLNATTIDKLKSWFPLTKTHEVQLNRDNWCFITRPQHNLVGKINALEAYGGGKLQFGFSQASVVPVPVSGKFSLDTMRMDLSFMAYDPWTQQNVSSVNTQAFKKDYSVGFGIDLGLIHLGPEFYRSTGLAEVTLKGLKNGVTSLAQALYSHGEEWNSHVMVSRDNYVVVVGGRELGLKAGDQLAVYNKTNTWRGEPCGDSSILTGSVSVSDLKEPWIVEVEEADNLMSKARVLNVKEDQTIDIGAVVKIHKLAPLDPQNTDKQSNK